CTLIVRSRHKKNGRLNVTHDPWISEEEALVRLPSKTLRDHGHPGPAPQCRFCSLIPGFGVKLSAIILAGPTVLSAVGACPPDDGVRRRWWINVASAVSLMRARKKSGDLTTAIVPAGTSFPARAGTL